LAKQGKHFEVFDFLFETVFEYYLLNSFH